MRRRARRSRHRLSITHFNPPPCAGHLFVTLLQSSEATAFQIEWYRVLTPLTATAPHFDHFHRFDSPSTPSIARIERGRKSGTTGTLGSTQLSHPSPPAPTSSDHSCVLLASLHGSLSSGSDQLPTRTPLFDTEERGEGGVGRGGNPDSLFRLGRGRKRERERQSEQHLVPTEDIGKGEGPPPLSSLGSPSLLPISSLSHSSSAAYQPVHIRKRPAQLLAFIPAVPTDSSHSSHSHSPGEDVVGSTLGLVTPLRRRSFRPLS